MELIHTYSGEKALKHWRYNANDKEKFMENFPIDEQLADRLCDYLRKENKVVDVIECYDAQSGWSGADFNVDRQNLSLNGYCFDASNVNEFLINRGF